MPTDTAPATTPPAVNGDAPPLPGEYVAVPTDLANKILGILGQLPYVQVADVVNELRGLPVRSS